MYADHHTHTQAVTAYIYDYKNTYKNSKKKIRYRQTDSAGEDLMKKYRTLPNTRLCAAQNYTAISGRSSRETPPRATSE